MGCCSFANGGVYTIGCCKHSSQSNRIIIGSFTTFHNIIFDCTITLKWMIPNQLAGLQVGFEIDDGLYEVHSLSKGKGGVKRLLRLQNVGFGIALYMMAMTGVLLLISELIFEPKFTIFQIC